MDRAEFTRLADRYAAYFLPFSLAVAGLAWLASGDSTRGLAVMVVATPCPLILAAPIAFVAGLSRAARAGVIVKGAGALERLGGARTVLLDKTGTLTLGRPELERIVPLGGLAPDEALRLAASVDQMSAHVLAESLVVGGRRRGLELALPTGGHGAAGTWHRRRGRGPPGRGGLERVARGERLRGGEQSTPRHDGRRRGRAGQDPRRRRRPARRR